MNSRVAIAIVAVIIAMAGLVVLLLGERNAPTAQAIGDGPIRIGWIGPLSGPAAALGVDSALAAQMAVDDINTRGGVNGHPVELLVEDDQYEVDKTVSAYHKLVGDGAQHIIILTYGGVFALANASREDNVLLIDTLDCDTAMVSEGNVMCIAPTTERKASVLAQQLHAMNISAVSILYNNGDTFMPRIAELLEREVKEYGGAVNVQSYRPGESDFKTMISKAQAAQSDGFVFLGYDEVGIAMRQAREHDAKEPFFGTGTVTSPGVSKNSYGSSEGTRFGFWDAPEEAQEYTVFTAAFQVRQGRAPIIEWVTDSTYDAIHLLHNAFVATNSTQPAKVIQALQDAPPYDGVAGHIDFARDGTAALPLSIHVLRNGTAVRID